MKFITETTFDIRTETLVEEATGKKQYFIEGIFLQADVKNRNGRIYPKNIMSKEVNRYIKESIDRKNAYGELGHPNGPTINLDRVSHLITSLHEDNSNFIGRAKLLDTPMGQIARDIMEGGGVLGISSRGLGSLKSVGGVPHVQEDFMLATAGDIVSNPSAPDAYLGYITEAPDWIWNAAKNEWQLSEIVEQAKQTTVKKLDEQQFLNLWDRFTKSITG